MIDIMPGDDVVCTFSGQWHVRRTGHPAIPVNHAPAHNQVYTVKDVNEVCGMVGLLLVEFPGKPVTYWKAEHFRRTDKPKFNFKEMLRAPTPRLTHA